MWGGGIYVFFLQAIAIFNKGTPAKVKATLSTPTTTLIITIINIKMIVVIIINAKILLGVLYMLTL